jgi:alpha,alpha-trehalase
VDGKPRYDGVTDFLASRGISLPRGRPTDKSDDVTVYGLGNHKQRLFRRLLTDGVPVFDSTVVLVRQLRDFGIGVAVYSSSRNCADVLIAGGIDDLFALTASSPKSSASPASRIPRCLSRQQVD